MKHAEPKGMMLRLVAEYEKARRQRTSIGPTAPLNHDEFRLARILSFLDSWRILAV
jgi:hypothetical protein